MRVRLHIVRRLNYFLVMLRQIYSNGHERLILLYGRPRPSSSATLTSMPGALSSWPTTTSWPADSANQSGVRPYSSTALTSMAGALSWPTTASWPLDSCTRGAWLFTRLVLLNGVQDYCYFKELYTSVYKPTGGQYISPLQTEQKGKQKRLVEIAEELADDEEWAVGILKDEEYFAVIGEAAPQPAGGRPEVMLIGIERRTIARKVTICRY